MKIIPSSRRHHYLIRASIFLTTLALIAGMVGCPPALQYDLTIASTAGGSVTTPGEGTFTYDEGEVVNLVAEAEEGYHFVNWTGDVGTIADANDATTTITIYGDYSITANFALEILEIWDWHDLHTIRDNLSGSYILMNDLDSTTAGYDELAGPTANEGKGWQPIGALLHPFTGTFDGQGYEIRDPFINRPDEDRVGLFGFVDEGGRIEDIGVVNADVSGHHGVGGLVGANRWEGNVSTSYSSRIVTGNHCVGGLVGANLMGTVSNSYSTGSITGENYVGGLVGANAGTVSNSYYSYDEVLINGENIITIGALFNEDFEQWLANDKFLDVNDRLSQEDGYYLIHDLTDFKQLLAFGQDDSLKFRLQDDLDLSSDPSFYVAYLAGEFDGNGHKIRNLSFNFGFVSEVGLFGYLASGGEITGVGAENVNITGYGAVGGLVGWNEEGTVSNSYSTGSVTGNEDVGGLVGWNAGTVSNSYSTGSVTGEWDVGGLVGGNMGTVSNSYSTGSVTGNDYVGGLVGINEAGTVSSSFWDTETSGQATSDGGTGKTTAETQDIATFTAAAWDIIAVNPDQTKPTYIWNIVDSETYPFLSWQSVS